MMRPMTEFTLRWPFQIDAAGSVLTTDDQGLIWSDRVASVIGTRVGERAMRPGFGSMVPDKVFDLDSIDHADLRGYVASAFEQFLPELTLNSVTVEDSNNGAVTLQIDYSPPNSLPGEVQTVLGFVDSDANFNQVWT